MPRPPSRLARHLRRCLLAGALAVLPAAGIVLGLVVAERAVAGSWLADRPWYVPGLGILGAVAGLYLLGLAVTTLLGRWLGRMLAGLLRRLPGLGRLYRTLEQILGYAEGEDALFQRAVLVEAGRGAEIGLVTQEGEVPGLGPRLLVFVPGSPNPTTGRLVLVEPGDARALGLPVHGALRLLLGAGSTPLAEAAAPPEAAPFRSSSADRRRG
jgi:uncharacterized membrane protein